MHTVRLTPSVQGQAVAYLHKHADTRREAVSGLTAAPRRRGQDLLTLEVEADEIVLCGDQLDSGRMALDVAEGKTWVTLALYERASSVKEQFKNHLRSCINHIGCMLWRVECPPRMSRVSYGMSFPPQGASTRALLCCAGAEPAITVMAWLKCRV